MAGLERRRPQLEVGRAPRRQRPAAEERAAEVRRPAAGAADDPPRRPLERRVPAVEHTCRDEHAERPFVAVDVELVAGPTVEGPPPVRADLRADPLVAEERERAPRRRAAPEVEVERPLALSAQVQAARGVEERGQLGQPDRSADRRDLRELLSHVLGRDHAPSP